LNHQKLPFFNFYLWKLNSWVRLDSLWRHDFTAQHLYPILDSTMNLSLFVFQKRKLNVYWGHKWEECFRCNWEWL